MSEQRSQQQLLDYFAGYVSPQKVNMYRMWGVDFIPGRREGVRVWDHDGGRSWIDCRSAGGVFNLGHRPPRIIAALKTALDEIDMSDHMLASGYRGLLAKRLAELTPGDLQYTTFGSSGGEAIDFALKLARGYTGRAGVISAEKGYHGHTGLALAATDEFGAKFGPLAPGFRRVPFGDFEALQAAVTDDVAAVIMETIPATAGFPIPPDDWYPRVRKLCDERSVIMILDEVQAGLGRTGRLWAYEEWAVTPDIMVCGKGMSAAIYPLSSATYRKHLQSFFDDNAFAHLSSTGGSELGCVTAMAMLDQITEPGFLEHVQAMGQRFDDGFAALREKYPEVLKGLNRRGLMIGVVMSHKDCGMLMARALAARGVIAVYAHYNPNILQLMPPLIIQAEEADEVLDAFDGAFQEVGTALTLARTVDESSNRY
ncbi:MAG: aminotransferase class III-fold pyridoxal phosphate-dependent enzyme [Dehalococcoidia bacterium]|nr:aminotransferase class III-fold pyridoxal phosphate-dependent enzyme [Dehalococcoidia bacterium]